MKVTRLAISLLVVLFTATAFAQSDAQATFTKLKSLAGDWAGKTSDGRSVQTTYRVTSGGSALMAEIHSEEDMVTMFHLDGDRLLMTHYCGAGNQPRMVGAISPDGKTVTFNYLDATNLLSTQPGHMERLVVTLADSSHYSEEWYFAGKDGVKQHEVFAMQRKK